MYEPSGLERGEVVAHESSESAQRSDEPGAETAGCARVSGTDLSEFSITGRILSKLTATSVQLVRNSLGHSGCRSGHTRQVADVHSPDLRAHM